MTEIAKVIAEVRKTRQTNMYSKINVSIIADSLGYLEVSQLIDNMSDSEYLKHLEDSGNY